MKRLRIKTNATELYDILAVVFVLSLPFSTAIPNIILGVLLLFYCVDFKKENFREYLKSPFLILSILLLFVFCKALYGNTFVSDFSYYKKYLYLISIPILFFKVNNLQLIKKATLIAVCAMILVSIYKIIKFYLAFKYFPFAEGWATNFVLQIERPYAGLFCLIAVIISFELFIVSEKRNYIYLISLFFSLGFIFMISIRTSILTFLLLFFIYTAFYLKTSSKKKVLFLLGLFLIIGLSVSLNKNIAKRFFIKNTISETIENTQKFEPRVVIYGCVKKVIQDADFSVLYGEDSYQSLQKKLDDCYAGSIEDYGKRNWFVEQRFNTHSQFIDFFLIGGIIAIIFFVLFLILFLVSVYKNFAATATMVAFIMILFIENVFHRQFGCFLFAVFLTLYFKTAKLPKTTENLSVL